MFIQQFIFLKTIQTYSHVISLTLLKLIKAQINPAHLYKQEHVITEWINILYLNYAVNTDVK